MTTWRNRQPGCYNAVVHDHVCIWFRVVFYLVHLFGWCGKLARSAKGGQGGTDCIYINFAATCELHQHKALPPANKAYWTPNRVKTTKIIIIFQQHLKVFGKRFCTEMSQLSQFFAFFLFSFKFYTFTWL